MRRFLVLPLFALALAAVVFVVFNAPAGSHDVGAPLDDDLCPVDGSQVSGSAAYLVDLRKPLADATAPSRSLRDVTLDLDSAQELRVFAITGDAASPRRQIDRLCKPYNEAEIYVRAAKDQATGQRDCDELPAQVSRRLRDLATRFCARRGTLQATLDRLAAQIPREVANTYLVEALEDTAATLATRPAPRALYVFSDMLQHAPWYSHLDLRWTEWTFETFAERTAKRAPPPANVSLADAPVTVFYPTRQRLTDVRRPRYAHQTFWRRYFQALEAPVDFVELVRAPSFRAPHLMVTAMDELTQDIEAALRDIEEQRTAAATTLALGDLVPPPVAVLPTPPVTTDSANSPASTTGRAEDERPEPAPFPAPATPPAAALDAAPAPAPTATPALAVQTDPTLPACAIRLHTEFADSLAPGGYPGGRRVNYGAATVTVRYTVSESGRTVEAEVVDPAQGDAMPATFASLAQDTVAEVLRWRFSFPDATPGDCGLAPQIATFRYVERCRGSPVPTCRTVHGSVTAVGGGS